MKKILLLIGLLSLTSAKAGVFTLTLNNTAVGGSSAYGGGVYYNPTPFVITTNRASVSSIEISANTGLNIALYDNDDTNAIHVYPNISIGIYSNIYNMYTNAAFVNRAYYTTNMLGTYIGANGFTNYTTNTGIFTYNVTNTAATNKLQVMGVFNAVANTYIIYPVDLLFSRGICAEIYTNTGGAASASFGASIVVNYR